MAPPTARAGASTLLPMLEFVSLPIVAEGFYDMTPDGQPIIDELDAGLWVAAGFSGHGFMVAPEHGPARRGRTRRRLATGVARRRAGRPLRRRPASRRRSQVI